MQVSQFIDCVGCNKLPFHEQFVRTVLEVNKCDCFGEKRNVLLRVYETCESECVCASLCVHAWSHTVALFV